MPKNIKSISLWEDNPQKDRVSNVVKINFNFPCTWTILHLEDLKEILQLWIKGEEMKYPKDKDVGLHVGKLRGRGMFKEFINKIFEETE